MDRVPVCDEGLKATAFADIVADPARLEVRRAGVPLDLEPKALKVLFYLIEHRDRVVPKEELIAEVWRGTAVTDNALTRIVSQIRKQLGDSARAPRYIETSATTGYRFIAEVNVPGAPAHTEVRRSWVHWLIAASLLLTAISLSLLFLRGMPSRPVQLEHLGQVTRSAAADLWPAFSPDGSQIAFSSNRSGVFEIYVQSLASGSVEHAVTSDAQENIQPAWSPDGRYLAYVARKRGGIAIIPASGGAPRYVTDHGDSPAWSPDGKSLAFRASSLDINPALETTGVAQTTIWLVGVDGSGLRPLTKAGAPAGGHNFPRWTEGGEHVLFSSTAATTGASRAWMVDVKTGAVHGIRVESPSVRSPALSPDGDHLYYAGAGGVSPGIWHVRLSRFGIGSPQLLVPAAGPTPRDLALSADGKRIAFGQQEGESSLWSLPLNPDGLPAAAPHVISQDRAFRTAEPVFSREGSVIAYSSVRQGGEWTVIVSNADGSNPRPVTDPEQMSGRPSWRGGLLGYRAVHHDELSYWLSPIQGQPSQLPLKLDRMNADRLTFSPDGMRIAAHITTPNGTQVVVEDLGAHTVRPYTPPDRSFGFPSWSPDGRWLAVQERKGGRVEMALMPASGGAIQPLQTDFTQCLGFGWSPDSSKIAFAGLVDGVWNLYWMALSTRKVQQLTQYTSHSQFVRYPAWSPKGEQIVFEKNNVSANIYVADLK